MTRYKSIIGRTEAIDVVGVVKGVPAKTDSGAFSSAISATNIRETVDGQGKKTLSFTILGDHPLSDQGYDMTVTSYSVTNVENSFGHRETRYVVILKVKMAGKTFRAPFTLADRSKKVFPVLLGRTLLNKRFIIDTSIANVNRRELKSKMKDWLKKDDLADEAEQ